MATNTPSEINGSDPTVLRQIERQNTALQTRGISTPPSVSGTNGASTTTTAGAVRNLAPIVSGSETLYPQSTTATSNNAVTINSSINNDTGDVTTVYTTNGRITVNPINQTINQYTSVDSGVSQIVAGNGVTISSTGASGTGVVTVSSSTTFGNIVNVNLNGNANSVLRGDGTWGADANSSYGNSNVSALLASFGSNTISTTGNVSVGNISATNLGNIVGTNYDGNAANVLHGDGTWSADVTNYGNSNVAAYLPTYTGNLAGDYLVLTHDANANVVYANYLYGDGSNITNLPVGNIASINLTGSSSNVLYGNGVFAAVPTTAPSGSNGEIQFNISGAFASTGNLTFVDGVSGGTLEIGPPGALQLDGNGTVVASNLTNPTGNIFVRSEAGVVDIRANSNVVLKSDNANYEWVFGNDGLTTLPDGAIIDTTGNNFEVRAVENVNLEANSVVNIYTDGSGNAYQWQFGDDGNLILAGGNSVIFSTANSSLDPLNPNVSTMTLTPDANYNSQVLVLDPTAPGHIHLRAYAFSNIDEPAANIFLGGENTAFEITSGANNQAVIHSNGKAWTFGNDGNISSDTLTFTTTFANVKTVEYQTAGVWDLYVEDSVTGSNTAISRLNVSFKDNLIDKPQVYIENTKESDGIALRWTFDENGNLNFPRDVAGNTDPYLSIFGGSTPTIQSTDVSLAGPANLAISADYFNLSGFSGDKIVFYADTGEMATDANMTLTTNLANTGNTSSWVFGADGNLTIPGTSGGFIKTVSNASIGIAAVDNGTNNPAQLLSLNSGSGAATSIVSAYSTNVAIQTNAAGAINTWAFDNTGNLTLPGNTLAINYANGTAAFGNISGINIDGSSSNVLYGNGVFAAAPSGSSYGDSNVTSLLGAFGSNTIVTTGVITADGYGLSNVPYGNLTGTPSLGNIASLNLDGSSSNVLYGNGVFAQPTSVPLFVIANANITANINTSYQIDNSVGNANINFTLPDGSGLTTGSFVKINPYDQAAGNFQYFVVTNGANSGGIQGLSAPLSANRPTTLVWSGSFWYYSN